MTQNPAEGGNAFLSAVYAAQSPAELQQVYDAWAASYDGDLSSMGYSAPQTAADVLASALADRQAAILDAGCGTGLVGAALAGHGFAHVDGADLSPGMLAEARKTGAYRALAQADLSQPLALKQGPYDAVICVGTLTEGHVGPEALGHFAAAVRPGGLVVATVLGTIWPRYRAFVDEMVARGDVRLLSQDETEYRPGFPIKLRVVVLQRTLE